MSSILRCAVADIYLHITKSLHPWLTLDTFGHGQVILATPIAESSLTVSHDSNDGENIGIHWVWRAWCCWYLEWRWYRHQFNGRRPYLGLSRMVNSVDAQESNWILGLVVLHTAGTGTREYMYTHSLLDWFFARVLGTNMYKRTSANMMAP